MAKQKKNTKLKALAEVLKMPADDAKEYMHQNASRIDEEYSREEVLSIFTYAHSTLYEEGEPTAKRRQAWTLNHVYIIDAICNTLKTQGRMPAISEISDKTKLSRVTVTKHLKHFEKEEYLQLHLQKWKLATEKVLSKLAQYVFSEYVEPKDSIKAAATYLKFAEKVLHPVRENRSTNNYIQINNIFIDQKTIQALPEDKRETIETLILEANRIEPLERVR